MGALVDGAGRLVRLGGAGVNKEPEGHEPEEEIKVGSSRVRTLHQLVDLKKKKDRTGRRMGPKSPQEKGEFQYSAAVKGEVCLIKRYNETWVGRLLNPYLGCVNL